MPIDVKICGLSTEETIAAAVEGGATYVGFVFYPPSPRMVTREIAQTLASKVPSHIRKVGLMVNPDDKMLQEIISANFLDMVQLHGNEVPERVAQIKERFGLPIIKCVFVDKPEDIKTAQTYEEVADMLLFDALAPKEAPLPGGNALAFDWELIRGKAWQKPWLLAGGLNVGNLKTAVKTSGTHAVDVSSGVEASRGIKCPRKIREFLDMAKEIL